MHKYLTLFINYLETLDIVYLNKPIRKHQSYPKSGKRNALKQENMQCHSPFEKV